MLAFQYQTSERQMPHITSPRPSKHLRQLHVKTIELQVGGWATPSNNISNLTFFPYFSGKNTWNIFENTQPSHLSGGSDLSFFQSFFGENIGWIAVSIAIESPFPRQIARLKIPVFWQPKKPWQPSGWLWTQSTNGLTRAWDQQNLPEFTSPKLLQTQISDFLPVRSAGPKKRPFAGRLMYDQRLI